MLFKLTCRLKKLSGKGNVATLENVVYGDVDLVPKGREKEDYENPGMESADGQSLTAIETTADNIIIYENISCASQPPAEILENSNTNNSLDVQQCPAEMKQLA